MAIFIVLWPYLFTTKLRCLQKNNIGHTKGGVHLNDYLSFNCLVNTGEELQSSLSEFECEFCQESMYGSSLQIVGHYSKCLTERDIKTEETYSQEERKRDPNAQEFDCKACGKLLYLTATEILRHRRSHSDS